MNNHKVLATFVVAILVASALVAAGRMIPLQNASAQTVTIKTSADSHDKKFFGNGYLQVIVTDPSKDDDNVQQDVSVKIDADPSGSFTSASGTFVIPETSKSSSRFEFYLAAAGTPTPPISPDNSNGIAEFESLTGVPFAEAPIIRFGAGQELPVSSAVFDDVSFDLTVGDEIITVHYEDSSGVLELDRSTYGSDSLVHLFIIDQDANKDPTNSDSFIISAADLNTVVFDLQGAFYNATVTFDETGDNTARFEAILTLGTELVATADAAQVTLDDRSNYDAPTAPENDSQDTSSKSFDIDNADGSLDAIPVTTFGTELKLTLRDNDQNKDSEDNEKLNNVVTVKVDIAGGDNETLDMKETDDNTGVFLIDLSNNELPITFLADGLSPVSNNSKLELRQGDITEDILVEYHDPLDDNNVPSVTSSFTIAVKLATGSVDVPDAAGINDDFLLTLTDADLNDNPRTKDSYTFVLNQVGPFNLTKGGNEIGALANLDFEIEGDNVDFGTQTISYTLVETDINSGVFTTSLDMQDFLDFGNNGAALDVNDGDTLRATYNDLMDTTSRESNDELAIGEANTGVDFTRTTLPIPPEAGSAIADKIGTEVTTTIVVTDPDSNKLSNAEDSIGFNLGTTAGKFFVEVDGDGFNAVINAPGEETSVAFSGTNLADIMQFNGLSLSETGTATGVFDDDIVFTHGSLDTNDWQDLKITITFVDNNLNEESAGVTFRGNDGTITVDQTSAKAGTILNIVVEDQDLNLDDTTAEEFSSVDKATGNLYLVAVETENDEIPGIRSEQFRESGPDTGIFTAEFTVGTDIPVSELLNGEDKVTQATNILITYNDIVDGSGGSGDEIEINVPVASATGAIQVMPELVGPGTSVTVLITDTDLDQDSRSTDNYDTPDPSGDNFMVSFRSDRTEVGRASPDIEETGPNTGVFDFQIDLVTDEKACEDDDLGASKFDAEGGSQPQIGACPGDLVSIRYEDEQDGSGRSSAVSAVVEVKSWDPEFSSDKPTYNVGDRVTITVSDPDANRDPDVADSLKDVRVFSDSDRVGIEISALETGRDTGVFRLVFGTTSTSAGGAITVKTGDDVTVQYSDDYPADFDQQENNKDFTYVVTFGPGGVIGSATLIEPVVKDPSGGLVTAITRGQQVVLTTQVTNTLSDKLPTTVLIEVRDSAGITQYLAWQTAVINANDKAEIGLSWTPNNSGDYQVRTLAVSNLSNPQVLALVKTTDITVS